MLDLANLSSSASATSINQVVSDFDGVTYHITAPPLLSETQERDGATKSQIQVSISVKCFPELVQNGAQDAVSYTHLTLPTKRIV